MASNCKQNPAVATFRAYKERSIEEIERFISGQLGLIEAYLLYPYHRKGKLENLDLILMMFKMIRGARAALKYRRKQ